jgi:7-cyano-7-deazaguanine reductase
MLQTMRNERPAVSISAEHILLLPPCCPVSHNPKAGSQIRICYRPKDKTLEVYSLHAYVQEFVDGHADGTRNMEAMIQKIAFDCANVLGVAVTVYANLVLDPEQQMNLVCQSG